MRMAVVVLGILAVWLWAMTAQGADTGAISASALAEIHGLEQEKAARNPAQRRLDSNLIYAHRKLLTGTASRAAPRLQPDVKFRPDGTVVVDITATVSEELKAFIKQSGGEVINSFPQYQTIRAAVPLGAMEAIGGREDVQFVARASEARHNASSVDAEGDVCHEANLARLTFGADGTGVKVGVISDDDLSNTVAVAMGNLPTNVVTLPGQAGTPVHSEGTAMLELIYRLAPGAQLYFATDAPSPAQGASNLLALAAAGCKVIVDDVIYVDESPFQEGQPMAQAVQTVSDQGVLYFSSAGNYGNKDSGLSGTWEGDFADGGAVGAPITGTGKPGGGFESGRLHNFGGGTNYNMIVAIPNQGGVALWWSDPIVGSTNDYDLFVLDGSGGSVVGASNTQQTGTQFPGEGVGAALNAGNRVVIVKYSGDSRFLHLAGGNSFQLGFSTSGNIRGHSCSSAANAFCVAATPAYTANPSGGPTGPYPNPFTGGTANLVEFFSSDGPRRQFYNPDGTPITPGNFLSTGGRLLGKPDFTAADGVSTSLPMGGGLNPFFGTSCAAPHAAAIAALLLSYNPSLTPSQVRMALTNTALALTGIDTARTAGAGIIMAYSALASVSTNSWTNAASGKWEGAANWSLGKAPDQFHTIIISNAASKTVTVDATTSGSFATTLTNLNLTVSAPSGTTNTLFLNNAGTAKPLSIVAGGGSAPPGGTLSLEGRAVLALNHSRLQISNNLYVGNAGGNCALSLTNGGTAYAGNAASFGIVSAANNSGLVRDPGSVLTCAGDLRVGSSGSGNALTVSNAGAVRSGGFAVVGFTASASNNTLLVTGAGSMLTCTNQLRIGETGSLNGLTVSLGATVSSSSFAVLGFAASSSNNSALVTGAGSLLSSLNDLHVGDAGPGNSLVISNGAAVYTGNAGVLGFYASSVNNSALVTGSGSVLSNATDLLVGYNGASNTLTVLAGGSVLAKNAYVGLAGTSAGNRLALAGSSLYATNGLGNGVLEIRSGALTVSNSTVTADKLLATNGANSVLQLNSGTLSAGGASVANNQIFAVGNGSSAASFNLVGGAAPNFYSASYSFANGLEVRSNSFLTGCGTISGTVTIDQGGTVQADCGDTLNFFGAVTNHGTITALNGTFINFYGPVVNSGVLNGSNGNVQFFSTVQNSGSLQTNNMAARPALVTLYNFTGGADGALPRAGLVQASDGNFYGTTRYGGTNNYGTVFRITSAGAFTNIHRFSGSDGASPVYVVPVQGTDGFLYGTANSGGQNGLGTVFKMNTTGSLAWWYSFSGTDGVGPYAGLVQASDGNFYGTTYQGGSSYSPGSGTPGSGTVFKITPAGAFTSLHSLDYLFEGNEPLAALVQGSDGNFYGSCYIGGSGNVSGTLFRITSAGTLTQLSANAGNPVGALIQGSDGFFYGTASASYPAYSGGDGWVFRMSSAGVTTTLHSFTNFVGEGSRPAAGLVQGSDGNFYGTTPGGGISNTGTVFRVTPSGALTTLYGFTGGTDGAAPFAGLVQGIDGNFYGTTTSGGAFGFGTVFKLSVYLVPPANQLGSIASIQMIGTNVVVGLTSIAGKGYQLQYRSSLSSGNWSNVVGAASNGFGGPLVLTDHAGALVPQRFYRVAITP